MAKKAPVAALRRNTKRILAALHASDIAQRTQTLIRESPPLRVLGLDINTNSTGYAVLSARGRVCEWGHISTAHLASSDVLGIAHEIDAALEGVYNRVGIAGSNGNDNGGDGESGATPAWVVGIEDFMRMYRFGRFHNKGIFQLAQLNGIVSYTCWQRFSGGSGGGDDAQPTHTHPSAARGFFGIAASKKSTKPSADAVVAGVPRRVKVGGESDIKEQVMAFVQQQQPQFFAPTNAHAPAAAAAACGSSSDAVAAAFFARTRSGGFSDAAFDVADAYVIAAFTRWRHLQQLLLRDVELAAQFADAYMALTTAHAESRPKSAVPTAEERALQRMDAAATRAHVDALFAHGLGEWIQSAAASAAN